MCLTVLPFRDSLVIDGLASMGSDPASMGMPSEAGARERRELECVYVQAVMSGRLVTAFGRVGAQGGKDAWSGGASQDR